MNYSDKLKDPRWQKRRLQILEAAHWRCEDCRAREKTLEVHHCGYIRGFEPWEYDGELLMALCSACHVRRQEREDALRVSIAKVTRALPFHTLDDTAWNLIHDAIIKASEGRLDVVR